MCCLVGRIGRKWNERELCLEYTRRFVRSIDLDHDQHLKYNCCFQRTGELGVPSLITISSGISIGFLMLSPASGLVKIKVPLTRYLNLH